MIPTPEEIKEGIQAILPDATFNRNFDGIVSYVKEKIIGQRSYMPELHIFARDFEDFKENTFTQTVVLFAEFPDTHEERCKIMMGLGARMAEEKNEKGFTKFPFQIVLVSEVYFTRANELPEGKRVQDMPGRKEGITVTAMSMDKRTALAVYEVEKDSDDNIIGLKEVEYHPYKEEDLTESKPYVLYPFWEGFTAALGHTTIPEHES